MITECYHRFYLGKKEFEENQKLPFLYHEVWFKWKYEPASEDASAFKDFLIKMQFPRSILSKQKLYSDKKLDFKLSLKTQLIIITCWNWSHQTFSSNFNSCLIMVSGHNNINVFFEVLVPNIYSPFTDES